MIKYNISLTKPRTGMQTIYLVLDQWFLALLEVLNRTSSIHAFIEPFVVGDLFSSSNSKHMYLTIYCIIAQTSGVNQTAEPLKLTHRTQVKNHSVSPIYAPVVTRSGIMYSRLTNQPCCSLKMRFIRIIVNYEFHYYNFSGA